MLLFFSMYDGMVLMVKNSMRRVVGLNTKNNRLNSVWRKICDSIEITNNWVHALSLVTSISLRAKYDRSGWHWSQNSPQIRVTALQSLLIYWYRLNIGPSSGAPLPLPTPAFLTWAVPRWGRSCRCWVRRPRGSSPVGAPSSPGDQQLFITCLSVCLPVCSAWRLSWTEVGMCYR